MPSKTKQVRSAATHRLLVARVSCDNDLGGTRLPSDIPVPGPLVVDVEDSWFDDETGGRFIGRLVDEAVAERFRQAGTTEYSPKKVDWDPARVYFSEFDILGPYIGAGWVEHSPGPWPRPSVRTMEPYRSTAYSVGPGDTDPGRNVARANAYLIAAAPDLLAALSEALKHAYAGGRPAPWAKQATAAVRKARAV